MALSKQEQSRRLIPALAAVIVHAAIFAGFLSLDRRPLPVPETEALPVSLIPPPDRSPVPVLALPGALNFAPPSVGIAAPVPDLAITLGPPLAPSAPGIGAYVGCGLDQALTPLERERCDRMRGEIFAGPIAPPDGDDELLLEQKFSRDKSIQDLPLSRYCYRRSGPDPLCFTRGYEALVGSTAARGSVLNTLADPLRPR